MGPKILERLTSLGAELSDFTQRKFGTAQRPLSELSDAELEEELMRRRRDRAAKRSKSYTQPSDRDPGSPRNKQLAQFYANLELEPGATVDDVKKAYRELMRRYHPDRHLGDAARHRAATELAQSLTRAYEALLEHIGK